MVSSVPPMQYPIVLKGLFLSSMNEASLTSSFHQLYISTSFFVRTFFRSQAASSKIWFLLPAIIPQSIQHVGLGFLTIFYPSTSFHLVSLITSCRLCTKKKKKKIHIYHNAKSTPLSNKFILVPRVLS